MPVTYWTIPEILKKRRRILRYTQHEVGEMLGVSRAAISQWENGFRNPAAHNLYDILTCLELSPQELKCMLRRLGK
jgi:transcriptional regulator with XRE-family HTH domain